MNVSRQQKSSAQTSLSQLYLVDIAFKHKTMVTDPWEILCSVLGLALLCTADIADWKALGATYQRQLCRICPVVHCRDRKYKIATMLEAQRRLGEYTTTINVMCVQHDLPTTKADLIKGVMSWSWVHTTLRTVILYTTCHNFIVESPDAVIKPALVSRTKNIGSVWPRYVTAFSPVLTDHLWCRCSEYHHQHMKRPMFNQNCPTLGCRKNRRRSS